MNSQLNNSSPQNRDSNIELLRIISIVLVLVTHACYVSLGPPTYSDVSTSFGSSLTRTLCESFSDVCVNVFILISGWFGINCRLKRFIGFIFQIYFINIVVYAIMIVSGLIAPVGLNKWLNLFIGGYGIYWFVKAYIILYIFAPILNAFVESCGKRQLKYFLISFYIFQTIHGFFMNTGGFLNGYSALSFMGLYLLARYIRLYPNKYTQLNKVTDIVLYISFSLLTTACALSLTFWGRRVGTFMFQNSSPFIILSTVYFFLFFTKLSFSSNFVNWVSTSSFAAYIVHCSPFVFGPYYVDFIRLWYTTETTPVFIFYTSCLISAYFVFSVMIDKLRLLLWKKI